MPRYCPIVVGHTSAPCPMSPMKMMPHECSLEGTKDYAIGPIEYELPPCLPSLPVYPV